MKNPIKILSALFLIGALSLSSCKKDPDEEPTPTPTPSATTGSIALHFENMVGDSALVFNTQSYVTANSDSFTVSTFKYYISNIVLTKSGGGTYVESESYHLIDASDLATGDITLTNVPLGDYTGISFIIGVDSLRNVSGAQTGALDPANGMFWSWSSGYIMLKFEGNSPQSTAAANALLFHVGGFSGANNTIRTVSPSFGVDIASVSSSVTPEIHFKTDILELFTTPTNVDFSTLNTIHMPGANAKTIADNYANMFTVEHIHN